MSYTLATVASRIVKDGEVTDGELLVFLLLVGVFVAHRNREQ